MLDFFNLILQHGKRKALRQRFVNDNMKDSSGMIRYRPDIQGLRAIAVTLVVLGHAGIDAFAGGFVGVDVFFVLSGFLITGLLIRERESSGRIRYIDFLSRRLKRLLPALLAMLIVVFAASSVLLSPYEVRMQTGSLPFAASWTSNLFFAFSKFDYFSELSANDLFLHTWSLGVEEQFYLVWPWLIVLAFSLTVAKHRPPNTKANLSVLLMCTFALSLWLCLYWAAEDPLLGFYMMPARGWQFALGALVFVLSHDTAPQRRRWAQFLTSANFRGVAAAVGLLMIGGSAHILSDDVVYPGLFALLPSVGTAMVIGAARGGAVSGPNKVLAHRSVVWVGDRSYSIYLWHWPVLLIGGSYGVSQQIGGVALLVLLSVMLASLSYRFIELPFWKGRYSLVRPKSVVPAAAAGMLLTVVGVSGLQSEVFGGNDIARSPDGYNPRSDMPALYAQGYGCDTWYSSANIVPCVVGNPQASRTAVLIGDSIGVQWFSMLPEIYQSPDWKVLTLTKSSCAIVDEEYFYSRIGDLYHVCTEWRQAALRYVADLKPDIVFIGSAASYDFSSQQWQAGVERILQSLVGSVGQVVLIPGTPALSFDGPSCIESPYRYSRRLRGGERECEEALDAAASEEVAGYLERAAAAFANVEVLNLNDLVCPGGRCAAQRGDGLVVFRDSQHLTRSFVIAQVAEVEARLDKAQLGPAYLVPGQELASGGP